MQLTRVNADPGLALDDRRRASLNLTTTVGWNDRTSLLLEVPDAKASDRASARPFRAALLGMLIGLVLIVALNACLAFLDGTPTGVPPWAIIPLRVN